MITIKANAQSRQFSISRFQSVSGLGLHFWERTSREIFEEAIMDDDVTIVRIYLKESDHGRKKSLMEEILNILQDQHRVHGVIVFRGIAGFGSKGAVHSADLLRLMVDLPLVIEFYDKPTIVQAAIALLSDLVPAGHIVHWRATCPHFDAAK